MRTKCVKPWGRIGQEQGCGVMEYRDVPVCEQCEVISWVVRRTLAAYYSDSLEIRRMQI